MSNATTQERRLHAANVAVMLAMRATEFVRESQRQGLRSGAITKDDASPVTVADFASQAVVVTALRRALPADEPLVLLGEESDTMLRDPAQAAILAAVVTAARAADPSMDEAAVLEALSVPDADPSHESCWTLDPVDGTKGFLRGGQYAICLAWIEAGEPTVGVMACPQLSLERDDPTVPSTTGLIAMAMRGDGASWSAAPARANERLTTPRWIDGRPVRLALSFEKAHGDASAAEVLAAQCGPLAPPLRLDSASKYVLVAHGRADMYLRIPHNERRENVWDHAAGVVIAQEAGCITCDLDGRPLDFGRGPTLIANRGIIVAPPALAERLVAAAGRE
ncbi:MAG: inositol monophosphatase family protein [Phycisphaerae bacterium]|nr:inositol monophosphatase family protein [Phycisphaerae bacterium]